MKLTPQERQLVDRMAPGVLCAEGFLGTDGRSPGEILAADAHAVESLGLTHERIAAKLDEIMRTAEAAFGNPVSVGEGLSAVCSDAMGPIPCPWGRCGLFTKGQIDLTDLAGGATLRFTPLSVHLVRRHGFYQGRGSRYRLDPADLARLLDMSTDDGTT